MGDLATHLDPCSLIFCISLTLAPQPYPPRTAGVGWKQSRISPSAAAPSTLHAPLTAIPAHPHTRDSSGTNQQACEKKCNENVGSSARHALLAAAPGQTRETESIGAGQQAYEDKRMPGCCFLSFPCSADSCTWTQEQGNYALMAHAHAPEDAASLAGHTPLTAAPGHTSKTSHAGESHTFLWTAAQGCSISFERPPADPPNLLTPLTDAACEL
eukprot:1160494-Pelagomonas_calceolata.AAC.21